jgi:hypothetical protein
MFLQFHSMPFRVTCGGEMMQMHHHPVNLEVAITGCAALDGLNR